MTLRQYIANKSAIAQPGILIKINATDDQYASLIKHFMQHASNKSNVYAFFDGIALVDIDAQMGVHLEHSKFNILPHSMFHSVHGNIMADITQLQLPKIEQALQRAFKYSKSSISLLIEGNADQLVSIRYNAHLNSHQTDYSYAILNLEHIISTAY
jgi:hypothetical protein